MQIPVCLDKNDVVLKAGDIFIWHNFPYQTDKNIKSRPFVFLGRTELHSVPFYFFMRTTTTKKHEGKIYFELPKTEITCLDTDSRIDFSFKMNSFPLETMAVFKQDLNCIGKLPQYKVNELIKMIEKDKYVSKITIKEIKNSFCNSGYIIK